MALDQTDTRTKTARLHRMVMPDHMCPYGLKSKDLLERHGYRVEDHHLTTRELKRACVGGASNVPLGFVSLTGNLGMIGMALWMGGTALG